jgi:protein-tyrosine kinase
MSIVEKALSKLHSNAEKAQAERRPVVEVLPNAGQRATTEIAPTSREFATRGKLVMDIAALQEAGVLPQKSDTVEVRNQFRRLKWPVFDEVASRRRDSQSFAGAVMIASALPGEGKTFTSCNLALSMAREEDKRVVLVDCDVAKPQLTTVLGLRDKPGLTDFVLQPSLGIADVLLQTNFDRLYFLPSGKHVPHAAELFSSVRLQQLLQELTTADPGVVVLLDTSPVMAINDAQVLARLIPQIILVVRADNTPQPTVVEACNILGREKTSAILNQAPTWPNLESYHGGGYGYYPHASEEKDKEK